MLVSVIIPTHNREKYITRAINSIANQILEGNIEIIVVDDASTDNTFNIVNELKKESQIPIHYLKNDETMGGAYSRNKGALIAKGFYIAFLDSDDEWFDNHLETGLKKIKEKKVKGIFSNFVISFGNSTINKKMKYNDNKYENIGDYIFIENGDARTSTLIFEKKAFDSIRFDVKLLKHQDWDLVIRFNEVYEMALNELATVILHNNVSNRMSNFNNHEASQAFIEKHRLTLVNHAISIFYTNLAVNTLRFEGRNELLEEYSILAKEYNQNNDRKIKLRLWLLNRRLINFVKVYDYIKKNVRKIVDKNRRTKLL